MKKIIAENITKKKSLNKDTFDINYFSRGKRRMKNKIK